MQTTTLKDLATPGLARLGLFSEVIADIRHLDRLGINDASFRSSVRSAIAERLPPLPGTDQPPPTLAPGSTPADAAGMIAAVMLRNAGPATTLLAQIAQAPVTITVTRAAHRALTPDEAALLHADDGTRAYERTGLMTTSGDVLVAGTRLLLIPPKLPAEAWEAIQAGEPAGAALGPYGMHRTGRKAFLSRPAALVDASAVLAVGDQMIGTSEERIPSTFCRHVVNLAES